VELGTFGGESAILTLGFPCIKKVHCVDQSIETYLELHRRVKQHIQDGRCLPWKMDFDTFLYHLKNSPDVVYIDGAHSYEKTSENINKWYLKLRPGGVLCGHDYSKGWPGVVKAVDEFSDKMKLPFKLYQDNSWMIQKP